VAAALEERIAANKGRRSGVNRLLPEASLMKSASKIAADSPGAGTRVKPRARARARARARRERSRNPREDRPANDRRTLISAGANRDPSTAKLAV
jgi:hypothetical protein